MGRGDVTAAVHSTQRVYRGHLFDGEQRDNGGPAIYGSAVVTPTDSLNGKSDEASRRLDWAVRANQEVELRQKKAAVNGLSGNLSPL